LHQNRRAFTIGKVPQAAFLDLPARSRKPRTAGLTHVLDKGLPIDEVRALLPMCAQYVDVWKFGWGVAYLDDTVAEKVALLREWQVLACPGGTLLEIAWAQGRSADCLAWAADCGFDCVEVSNGTVGMPAVEKRALVETAASRFTVLAEVGSKDPQAPVSSHQWAKQARADLSAGARWVVIEGRESGSVGLYEPDGQVRSQLVSALTDAVGVEQLIFEAPRRDQQVWLLRSLGSEVSLGNIASAEVLGVETLRLGLRADTFSPVAGRAAGDSSQ
jgi:phosphosulfolactate synthase